MDLDGPPAPPFRALRCGSHTLHLSRVHAWHNVFFYCAVCAVCLNTLPWCALVQSIASGTTMMALCFALDHQLKHRQGILWAAQTNAADYTATTTLSVNNATRTKSVSDRASVGLAAVCRRCLGFLACA